MVAILGGAGRLARPHIWLGAGCVLVLLVVLAMRLTQLTRGGDRDDLEQAAPDNQGAVVAVLQLSAGDQRSVRQVCNDEGLPAALCDQSVRCASADRANPGQSRRLVRLLLRGGPEGGCGWSR